MNNDTAQLNTILLSVLEAAIPTLSPYEKQRAELAISRLVVEAALDKEITFHRLPEFTEEGNHA